MSGRTEVFYRTLDQYYAHGNFSGAEEYLRTWVSDSLVGGNPEALIAAYNELGSLCRSTSRFPQSLEAFECARTLTAQVCGTDCIQYATILNNMAGTYRMAGSPERAVELFRTALELYRANGEETTYLTASVWNNLSLAYRETGQLSSAVSCLEQALEIMESLPEYRQELAITLNNLAALYYATGEQEKTAACLDRSIALFDQCEDENNVHYAAGLNTLAGHLYELGHYSRALELYQKSAQYTERWFGRNIEYVITYQNMAVVYRAMDDKSGAVTALREAYTACISLLGSDHERTQAIAAHLRALEGRCEP